MPPLEQVGAELDPLGPGGLRGPDTGHRIDADLELHVSPSGPPPGCDDPDRAVKRALPNRAALI